MITQRTRDLPDSENRIGEEAAGLLLRFIRVRGISAASNPWSDAAILRWSDQSPLHRRILVETVDTYRRLTEAKAAGLIDFNELLTRARSDIDGVAQTRPNTWPVLAVAAAILVCLGIGLAMYQSFSSTVDYSTAIGEQKTVMLRDGSKVTLNTNSKISAIFGLRTRRVQLISGEALFDVSHDNLLRRRFLVEMDNVTAEDLGTQFNVYRREHRATVSVIKGHVRLTCDCAAGGSLRAAVDLHDGEQGEAILGENGTELSALHLDSKQFQNATSWQTGTIDLTGMTLTDAVRELNRYTNRRLVVADPSIADKKVDGLVHLKEAHFIGDFLTTLTATFEVDVISPDSRDPDLTLIYPRKRR